jgi:hypothetical protein
MSDIQLPVEGAVMIYKARVAVTIADLSVHASQLDSLLRTCLAEAGLRCSLEVEAAYGMVYRVRDVQRSFVSICGPCEVARNLYPPYAPRKRHLPGLSREAEGVLHSLGEMVCRISEHLRPPLLECHGKSSQPISSARCLAAGPILVLTTRPKEAVIETRDGMLVA